jgi:photosystem II stability/assembly factor-like uncharacterized protein
MKKLYIIIAIIKVTFLLSADVVKAQWIPQYTGTSVNLYDIEFINENTGWAVGDGGVCLKTTNGGINWIQQNQPVGNKPLNSVHIVDSNVVYFVGYFQTIFKTIDGGTNWRIIRNGPWGGGISYYSVYFINKDTGWIGEQGQYVLRTFDGGETFDSAATLGSNHDIVFLNRDTGFISAEGMVYKTTNAGTSWYPCMQLPYGYIFRKISFLKNGYGWVVGTTGGGKVYKTTNYGENWINIYDSFNSGMETIYFINKDTGFVGGAGNWLLKTINGGCNWKYENLNIFPDEFKSFKFVNDTIGWLCATGGIIYKTTTQGETLTKINNNEIKVVNDYFLLKNYPNPFNSQTKISFSIPKSGFVNISVYDILGKKVDDIINKYLTDGIYEINYNANKISSGIYIYTLNVNGMIKKTNKLILIK